MKKEEVKILFLGTPEIAAYVLEGLILNNYNIIGVVSQPDREKNRKGMLLPTDTKVVAQKYNIPIYQFEKLKPNIDFFKKINPDLILTIAYGKIVPEEILNIPKFGCLNLHGSILPKLRGAAPIQRALFEGYKETGFTLMQMVKEMDAGDMYAFEKVKIDDDDIFSTLFEKMKNAALELALKNLPKYFNNELIPIKQDLNEVTFANKIEKSDEKLSLNLGIFEFVNRVRGLSLKPGGYLLLENKIFKILKCKEYNDIINHKVGELFVEQKNKLIIQLSDGQVLLEKVQLQGKNVVDAVSFINGHKDYLNQILS